MTTKLKTPDVDLIELSGKWVYQHPKVNKNLKVNGNTYKVKEGVYDTPTGLDYMVVENLETGEISMIFEGTQGGKDVITDGTLPGSVPNAQLKAADEAYKKECKKYQIENVSGNSLGGGLANYVASNNEGVRSVTYNPAILPAGDYDQNNPRITNYLSEYDPLTLGERGAGYGDRLPGESVILHNNVPWMQTAISNHVGYSDEQVEVNGKKITIDADAYLPVGIWSGQILTGKKGQRIDINPENIRILANSLQTRMTEQVSTGQFYLDTAVDIVNQEGNRLDDRKTTLQKTFDNLLAEAEFGNIITSVSNYAILREELELLDPVTLAAQDVIQRVRTLPILGDLLDAISGSFFTVVGFLIDIPILITDLLFKIEDIADRVSQVKLQAVPKLFNGIDNHFFSDAMVAELKEHYTILDKNKDSVTNQVLTFGAQAKYVSDELEKADKLLSADQQVASVGAPPKTQNYALEESKALKNGMGKKQQLLDKNFQSFSTKTSDTLVPALSDIRSVCNQLEAAINSAIFYLMRLQKGFSLVDVPFTSADNNVRQSLNESIKKLREGALMIDGVGSAVKALESNLPNVLNAYRPYIDTALFEGTKFHDVILLNKAAYNIFDSAKLIFEDVKYQLSENEAAAISALDQLAVNVVKNMKTLLKQIERGSINV